MNLPVPPPIPDYELLRPIGRGSYGDVWLARGVTGVWRAIKIVWRERFADAGPFEREFKGLKEFAEVSLGESIQLALLHVGRNDAAGFFYYVMELADDAERGRAIEPATYVPLTLAELRLRRGRIAVAEALRFGVELARVLAGLHRRGLVHRDIKPSNVILVGGVPKLADIGLVAPADSARTFVGTEGYVPPEGPGTPGADVFALGKLLYELATGLDRQEFPQLPAELNRLPDHRALLALNEVILRACDPEPRPRYRDSGELLADLEALHAGRRVRRAPWGKAAALLIVGAAVGLGWWQWRLAAVGPKPPRAAPSAQTAAVDPAVAVLPFANVGGDPGQEYFSDGLTEEILNALARERGLRVPGRASSFAFKGRNLPAAEIGRALGVGQLVEGSVQRAGGRVRIRVQITRAADGFSEALGNFDRDGADVFALQDEVARAVVEKLTRRHAHARGAGLTKDAAAYDAYLRGRALHPRSAEGARAAIPFYEQAVTLDPAFALAWAHLAAARFRPYGAMDDRSPALAAAARSAIDRALALEPDLPEALIARAVWHRSVDHDYAAAQRDLERAEAQRPATGQLRFSQATLALSQGDWASAARLAGEALALDPQNGDYTNAAAITFFSPRGEFAAADRLLERAMAIQGPGLMSPFSNRVFTRQAWRGPAAALRLVDRAPAGQSGRTWVRAELLAELGRGEEARAIIEAAERDTDPASPTAAESARVRRDASNALLTAAGRDDLVRRRAEERRDRAVEELARGNVSPLVRSRLVDAEIALGRREAALIALGEWRDAVAGLPSERARLRDFGSLAAPHYARLGRADETVAILRAMGAHGFSGLSMLLRNTGDFAPIREDPRFQELAAQAAAVARAQPDPTDEPAPAAVPPADEKSIAVLPFVNMSDDKENAFFADGVHEDVLTHLQDVSALKVISRASVVLYREAKKPVAEIGRELGVVHVLTGSVRRAGNRVRVSAQLSRAANGVQLWAKTYDRDAGDVFAVQAELAREITAALRATLSPAESDRLARPPTANLAAYELVKQVRAIEQRGQAVADTRDRILPLLNQAVALDPNYAEAWAMLSRAHTDLLGMGQRSPERETLARAALAQADRLAPDAYASLMAGSNLAAVIGDRTEVNRRRARVVELFPGRPEAHHVVALTASFERRWTDALAGYRAALRLDPRNASLLGGYLDLLTTGRRYEEAEPVACLLAELRPEDPLAKLDWAVIPLEGRGVTEPLEALAKELAARGTEEASVIMARSRSALRLGWSQDVVDLWRAAGPRFAFLPVVTGPGELTVVAGSLLELGEAAAARALLAKIRGEISGRLATEPQNTALHNQMGLVLALEGDRAGGAAALGQARALIQANPTARWVPMASWENAGFRAWVGETDEAVAEFRRLFRQTGRTPWANVHVMRRLWLLKPLRGHPQFEALLDDPASNAPLF